MKKLLIALIPTAFCIVYLLSLIDINSDYFSAVVTLIMFGILILSYIFFEKSVMGTKEIALIATLSTLAALFRAAFAAFPSIKPTTFMVAITGLVFGSNIGFLVGSTTGFISNIFLGQGPWTPWQMFAWGIVGAISGVLGKKERKFTSEFFSVICFAYGFLFDWIMNLWHVLGFVRPFSFKTIFLAYLSGLTFDIMHAAGNFVFCIIFYDNFLRVLKRFKRRLQITYLKPKEK